MLHSDPPRLFLAESEDERVDDIRAALREEEWARSVELWLLATDEGLDVWGSKELVWDGELDDERVAMEIRLAPIFEESDHGDVH